MAKAIESHRGANIKLISKITLPVKVLWLFIFAGFLVAAILMASSSHGFNRLSQQFIYPHIQNYFELITDKVGTPPNLQTAQSIAQQYRIDISISGDGIDWRSYRESNHHKIDANGYLIHTQKKRHLRSKKVFMVNRDGFVYKYTHVKTMRRPTSLKFIGIGLVGVLIVLVLLYLKLRYLIKPISTITQGIKDISKGDFTQPIIVSRQNELGKLANAINRMSDDISNMLESKHQLLLAISHELRSPLARSKVATSLLPTSKAKDNINQDLLEMECLINDLLEAEHLNQRHQALRLTDFYLNDLIETLTAKSSNRVHISLKLDTVVGKIRADKARLRFVINNLIDNAIKHRSLDDEMVLVHTVLLANDKISLVVQNFGTVVDAEHIPHLTEPFYRVDPSRQRKTGGYGLGLYIVKMIVNAHHGKLEITSSKDYGTQVKIILPQSFSLPDAID